MRNRFPRARSAGSLVACAALLVLAFGSAAAQSAPGGRIAFASDRHGGIWQIWTMDADGGSLQQLTSGGADATGPSWSPDGSLVAFTLGAAARSVAIVGADGSDARILVPNGQQPSWAPDGSRIAFSSALDGSTDIYTVDPHGDDLTRLTRGEGALAPQWSPDGNHIAFVTVGAGWHVAVMNADGTGIVEIAAGMAPAWSPDGTKLLFESTVDGNADIYAANADGTGVTRVTSDPAEDTDPAWSPDGSAITFTSNRSADTEIFRLTLGVSGATNLTQVGSAEMEARWRPAPPSIAGVPAPMTVEATGPAGAPVSWTDPTTSSGARVHCSPASGSTFPLATLTVRCDAVGGGAMTTGTFDVTVRDTTAPVLSKVPDPLVREATGPRGAAVRFTLPTARDVVAGSIFVGCSRSPGDVLPLGSTTVTCAATDPSGNTGKVSFGVTVRDTTPPALQLPRIVRAKASSASGRTLRLHPRAKDLVDGFLAETCAPRLPGHVFKVGTTVVRCSARDRAGNRARGSFRVVVTRA
jgi:hypothetical protein